MQSATKKRPTVTGSRARRTTQEVGKVSAAGAIRRMGDEWARHWNAGDLHGVAAVYAEDAVYLPPHHEAIHGRDAIREYLKSPLSHGVSDLALKLPTSNNKGLLPGM